MTTVRELYSKAARDTALATRHYWLNSAFLSGHQWLFIPGDDPTSSDIHELPETDRVQMVDNRMGSNHRTIMGNAMQRKLEFAVRPSGADDAAQQAAALATEICYYLHSDHNWEGLREDVASAMLKGGTAALALDWDPHLKDTKDTALSIAEFVVEPGARDPEKARWWIKAELLPPEEVQAIYSLEAVPEASYTGSANPMSTKLMTSHLGQGMRNALTLVLTYYERPNAAAPKGKHCVEINGHLVHNSEWMFPFTDRLNLSVGTAVNVEGRWFGDTSYSFARSPQVALNYAQSNLSEHLRNASVARMAVPHSAIHLLDSLDDVPGNMFPYADGNALPSWMQPAQLPAWLERLLDNYRNSIDDAMGSHDISRGRAPANLESGSALSILAEMDGTPTGRLMKQVARMFGHHAQLSLQTIQAAGGSSPRFSTVETDAGPLAIKWKASDIAGQWDVSVPEDSIIPRSPAAQLNMTIKMMEMGLITNLSDFIRFSESPGMREILDVVEPAVAKARRNHSLLAMGEPVVPSEFDDFTVLISEGNKFRMGHLYERLDEEDQDTVDLYMQACETLAAEQAAKMQARSDLNPALGAVPSADGAPPVEASPDAAMTDPAALEAGMVEAGAQPPAGIMDQIQGLF